MGRLFPGNAVVFARGRSNRRSCPSVGVVVEVVSDTHAWVACNKGKFLVRTKDCIALLCTVPSSTAEHKDA